MTLVFPLLLGGLALISIPVLIHLIRRQKPKIVKFPAFRFLVKRQRTNLRKLRLRHLLLLALRILLLVLICLALARPKVISQAWNLSTDRPVAAVLVFDTSYSMAYKITGGETRLEDAKRRGLELLDELPAGSRVAILDTAEPVVSRKGDFVPVAKARQRIEALRLRHDSQAVTARLQDAYRIFRELATHPEDWKGRRMPRLLCVLSDGMQSSWVNTDTAKVLDLQDTVPPPLERVQLMQNSMPARLELLQTLRTHLPPPEGKDYPEQALIEAWQKLRPRLSGAYPDDFPDRESMQYLMQIRLHTRNILKLVRSYKKESLTTDAQEYRKNLVDALSKTLDELQGVYSVFINVGVEKPVDLAIIKLEFPAEPGGRQERNTFGPDETFVLSALVQATGQDFDGSIVCEVGKKKLTRPVALKAGEKRRFYFDIDGTNLSSAGAHQLQVRLSRPDLLDFTNRRFGTFAIRQQRKILIVTDFLRNDVDTFRKAIDYQENARFRCDVKSKKEFVSRPNDLAKYHAIYLFGVQNPDASVWGALKNYVDRGGNIAIIPGNKEETNLHAYNEDNVAQKLMPAKLKEVKEAKPGLVWDWDDKNIYQRPLFKRFLVWRRLQADFIRFPRRANKYWRVEPAGTQTSVLVRYLDPKKKKPPAVLERDTGKGKVILMTTRLDNRTDNDWNNYMKSGTSFVVVWPNELTRYLAGDSEHVQMNFIGSKDVPRVKLPLGTVDLAFTLKGPNVFESASRSEDQNELTFPKVAAPGNYEVRTSAGDVVGAFSVNFPESEAVLKPVPPMELESVFSRDKVVALTHQMDLKKGLQGHWSEPSELFPWLMIGLLVFLVLENLLSNLFYRRQKQPQT